MFWNLSGARVKEGRDFLSDLMKNAQRERSSFMPNQIQQSRSSLN